MEALPRLHWAIHFYGLESVGCALKNTKKAGRIADSPAAHAYCGAAAIAARPH